MGRYDDGLADAAKCIELDADWSKVSAEAS
jgi:hypothetical protein